MVLYSTQWYYTRHIGTQLYTPAIYSAWLSVLCSVPYPLPLHTAPYSPCTIILLMPYSTDNRATALQNTSTYKAVTASLNRCCLKPQARNCWAPLLSLASSQTLLVSSYSPLSLVKPYSIVSIYSLLLQLLGNSLASCL